MKDIVLHCNIRIYIVWEWKTCKMFIVLNMAFILPREFLMKNIVSSDIMTSININMITGSIFFL